MSNWLKNYKNIYEGWKNDLFPTEEILAISEPRAKICASCPLNNDNTCSKKLEGEVVETFFYKVKGEMRQKGSIQKGCGCPLIKKTKALNDQCPLNKW